MAINALAYNENIRKEFRDRQAAEALVELIRLTKDKDILEEGNTPTQITQKKKRGTKTKNDNSEIS